MSEMRDLNRRETGKRVPKVRRDPDPNDDFSQQAAENRRPRDGFGLSEAVDETSRKTRKSEGMGSRRRT